jgi:hypothetical protein
MVILQFHILDGWKNQCEIKFLYFVQSWLKFHKFGILRD